VDTCSGGGAVAAAGGYRRKNKLETTSVAARNGRYMFSILDAGLDGVCCNGGGPGSYEVYVDGELRVSGGEFGASEYKLFGDCSEQNTTSKPTNNVVTTHPTANPTSEPTVASTPQPTSNPTNSLVSLRVSITFDSFPEDISWTLRNTCHGDVAEVASGGKYGGSLRGQTISEDIGSTPDGTFEFQIKDSYGDGLCCARGNGTYAVSMNGEEQISMGKFGDGVGETRQFGSSDRCNPSAAPTPLPTQAPTPPSNRASFDSALGAPKCGLVHPSGSCTTFGTELLNGKANSVEQNPPNSLDECADGSEGVYKEAESIEAVSVTASDAASGGVLRAGGRARIKARVYAYQTGNEDMADFFYTSTPEDPIWIYVSSAPAPSGGFVNVLSEEFVLPSVGAGARAAVRVNYRWTGESLYASSCSGGRFDDVDDLVFAVEAGEANSFGFAAADPAGLGFAAAPDILGAPPPPPASPPVDCARHGERRCVVAEQFCEWREEKRGLFSLKGSVGSEKSCYPLPTTA